MTLKTDVPLLAPHSGAEGERPGGPLLAARTMAVLVSVFSFGAVFVALISQYQFGMQPCPWCTFQRLIFLVIGVLALLCAAWPGGGLGRSLSAVTVCMALGGVASALWQHFVAAKSGSCAMTLADHILDRLGLFRLLPSVFEPKASCAEAAVRLLGLPYEFWSLALFVICAGLMLSFLWMAWPRRFEA